MNPFKRFCSGGVVFCLLLLLSALAASTSVQPLAAPLGATPHAQGTVFRVWAPFVEEVQVRINDGAPQALKKEAGRADDDAVWFGDIAGAKAGDRYQYVIKSNGVTNTFIDPRSRQLTGSDDKVMSVIVDTTPAKSSFKQPSFNQMVVYELHIGTFNMPGKSVGTFADAAAKLDYLKDLGINAIEVMPVHQNLRIAQHAPPEHNWGYDAVHLFAVNSAYGSPEDFKKFIRACHDRQIAVILDVVYNHMVDGNLLRKFGGVSGPNFMNGIYFYGGDKGNTDFGPRPDFGRAQVRAFIQDNSLMWLREFGVDGLRWDSTSNIRSYRANDRTMPIPDGETLMRDANNAYRNTDPKEPQKISI
ncbi:MAG: hypothetical protein JO254_06525, partial [Pseudolabrys sp.]|nr:hypothetical protein [Pseudolabrys sp.]